MQRIARDEEDSTTLAGAQQVVVGALTWKEAALLPYWTGARQEPPDIFS